MCNFVFFFLPEDTDMVGFNTGLPKIILWHDKLAQLNFSYAEKKFLFRPKKFTLYRKTLFSGKRNNSERFFT
jgi:hypothetical protein